MAPTYDLTGGAYSKPMDALGKYVVLKNVIDFSDNNVANAETMAVFNLPANFFVREVLMNVTDADALISNIDVGIVDGDTDGFIATADISSTGWKRFTAEAYIPPTGYINTSNAQIGIINNDAQTIDDAVIEFFLIAIDLN